jgi:hypothetical protein
MPAIQTALKCEIVMHLVFFLQIFCNPNHFEMWQLNSDIGLHTHNLNHFEMQNSNSFGIFYKYSTFQTALKCSILIQILVYIHSQLNHFEMWNTNSFVILQILHNPNHFEMQHLNSNVGLHTLTT